MQELSPLEVSLHGKSLVEASAGTGKTWTIAALYVRLIVERGLNVDRILVVTFTKAATAELRQRLRDRLAEALAALSGGDTKDDFLIGLKANIEDVDAAQKRLLLALRSFDESAIFTIHGFCQRLLGDAALEANMPFEQELQTDENELIQRAVDDFWRRLLSQASPAVLSLTRVNKLTPESLLDAIRPGLGKPYLTLLRPDQSLDWEAIYADLSDKFAQVKAIWQASESKIRSILHQRTGLSKSKYQSKWIESWLAKLSQYLQSSEPDSLPLENSGYAKWVTRLGAHDLAEFADGKAIFPSHAFFGAWQDFVDAYPAFDTSQAQLFYDLCFRLRDYLNTTLYREKQAAGIITNDDLLLRVDEALRGEAGERLVTLARERYPVAMIDEFQDTDPVQYDIFSRIYDVPEQTAFFVGDPKQAIYGFRGADVFTYLGARDNIQRGYTLSKNYRSTEGVLKAVNALFEHHARPFWLENIPYQPVSAGKPELSQESVARHLQPFRLLQVGEEGENKTVLTARVAEAVANDIAGLLNRARSGSWTLGEREFNAGDVAVLVRTHGQAALVRDALNRRGIVCVQRSRDNVLQSEEATELRVLLNGIAAPSDEGRVKAALATRLLGWNATDFVALREDMNAWEQWLERFGRWRSLWLAKDFVVMFRRFMQERQVYSRLLALTDGERRLTNFLHLAELLYVETAQQGLGMDGLIGWLGRAIQDESESDERLIRLESDENLVRIMTVHNSKGLEFGVVYCPFLWVDGTCKDNRRPFVFHDPENHWRPTLELGSAARARWLEQKCEEEFADSLRLLYVAVTRARFHCSVVVTPPDAKNVSTLSWLLHGHGLVPGSLEQMREMLKQCIEQDLPVPLTSVMSLEKADSDTAAVRLQILTEPALGRPRRFRSMIAKPEIVTSYSALTSDKVGEQPDYDYDVRPPQAATESRFRGAQAGSCLHHMLELLDFTVPVSEQAETVLKPALVEYGFSESLLDFSHDWLQRVLDTPLTQDGEFSLSKLQAVDRLNEMEFWFPVDELNVAALCDLLRKYLPVSFHSAIGQLNFGRISGYLKGYIDLIYRHQGRYYVVDYKSNWLGAECSDYVPERMTEAIAEAQYYLQYLLYTVAVQRLLRLRLPDYDYDRDFGEVQYLFLRGMDPQNGGASGIYVDRPPVDLVHGLEQWLASD